MLLGMNWDMPSDSGLMASATLSWMNSVVVEQVFNRGPLTNAVL
jgi:hypothetical protein